MWAVKFQVMKIHTKLDQICSWKEFLSSLSRIYMKEEDSTQVKQTNQISRVKQQHSVLMKILRLVQVEHSIQGKTVIRCKSIDLFLRVISNSFRTTKTI